MDNTFLMQYRSAHYCSMSEKEEVKDVKSELVYLCVICMYFYPYSRSLALDWTDKFCLPTRFSKATSEAIESGVLTRRARVEIHNALATLISCAHKSS